MRSQQVKDNLLKGRLTIGSWLSLGDLGITEIMARSGFDWLGIDMEHSAITIEKAQEMVRVIDLCGLTVLVRVGANDHHLIKRVMDTGAHGVIVPMINTAAEARAAVAAVKYPPEGKRGVGLSRAQGYGMSFEKYKEWVGQHSIVIVQIEHIEGVANLAEILDVKGVDGFLVGPYDLSGSMGIPGRFDDPRMKKALKTILSVARKKGRTAGFHVVPADPRLVAARVKEGFRFVAYSVDFVLLGSKCSEGVAQMRRLTTWKGHDDKSKEEIQGWYCRLWACRKKTQVFYRFPS